jgi:hypothetical protein
MELYWSFHFENHLYLPSRAHPKAFCNEAALGGCT